MSLVIKASHQIVSDLIELVGDSAPWFGVCGANIEDVVDSALNFDVPFILSKHEFGAACMADAYYRTSGKPTCLLTTSGPGALNALPGIAEAHTSGNALLAILGDTPHNQRGQGSFQEASGLNNTFDMLKLFQPISAYSCRVTSIEEWPEIIEKTRQTLHGSPNQKPGPVVLLLPKDIQKSFYDPYGFFGSLQKTLNLLQTQPKGALIVGEEVAQSLLLKNKSHVLKELAERFALKIVLTAEAKACLSASHPQYGGTIGALGDLQSTETLKKAAWIGVMGTRLSFFDRFGIDEMILAKIKFAWAAEKPWPQMPAAEFTKTNQKSQYTKNLTFLLQTSKPQTQTTLPFQTSPQTSLKAFKNNLPTQKTVTIPELTQTDPQPITLTHLYPALQPLLTSTGINIIADAGNATAAIVKELNLGKHSTFTIALGMGAMGYSFGAGIGTYTANHQKTFVLAGDGSFYMHGSEIHTALEYKLPIQYIILNNNAHAMCVTRDQLFCNRTQSSNRFQTTPIAAGLKSFYPTIKVLEAQTLGELNEAVTQLKHNSSISILVINLSADEFPSFLPFQGVKP